MGSINLSPSWSTWTRKSWTQTSSRSFTSLPSTTPRTQARRGWIWRWPLPTGTLSWPGGKDRLFIWTPFLTIYFIIDLSFWIYGARSWRSITTAQSPRTHGTSSLTSPPQWMMILGTMTERGRGLCSLMTLWSMLGRLWINRVRLGGNWGENFELERREIW